MVTFSVIQEDGPIMGNDLLLDGYRFDSRGAHIQISGEYAIEYRRYDGVLAIWPYGTEKPLNPVALVRYEQ